MVIPLPVSSPSSHHLRSEFRESLSAISLLSYKWSLHMTDTWIFLELDFCHVIPLLKSFQWLSVTLSRHSSDYYPILSFSDTIMQDRTSPPAWCLFAPSFTMSDYGDILCLFPSLSPSKTHFYLSQLQSQNLNPLCLVGAISVGYHGTARTGYCLGRKDGVL